MADELNAELTKQLTAVLEAGVSDDAMKAINKQVDRIRDDIESDIMYRLKDELAPNLAAFVTDMAKRTVTAILEGNECEMRRYLSCENPTYWNGRSDADNPFTNPRKIEEWHQIIHGKLYESGCVALRKAIVEAHADLLKNERILDLEDQIKSLIVQVNKANAAKDAMWARLGHLEDRA